MKKDRFDRNRLMIGAYCLAEYARSEEHIRQLAHAGVNFLCGVPASDRALLDKCGKYGIGVLATRVLPGWWGGHGENAGGFAQAVPVEAYRAAREKYEDHPAIWGLDMGDEPSALEFPHYGKLFEEMKRLFPGLIPYLNLYPAYGVLATCSPEEVARQLGTETYEEYIDRFFGCVESDYFSYDYYMYSSTAEGAYENLSVASEKCRATGRDLWIVLQLNSNRPDAWISSAQLRHQAYTALAFGARVISWACWTAGWWHHQALDSEGKPTRQYERICRVNRELHAMGERYMKYRNQETRRLGADRKETGRGLFDRISVEEGGEVFVGFMHEENGCGQAAMIACCGWESAGLIRVGLRPGARLKSAMLNGLTVPAVCAGDGEYLIRMEGCGGLLLETE